MAKFFSAIALLACLVAVNAADVPFSHDEEGNDCGPCATTNELNRVCGSNGITYPNPGALKCHNKCLKSGVTLKHYGQCHASTLLRKVRSSGCVCLNTLEYMPVCGTNGKTYPNKGALKCDAECQRTSIQVKHGGKCQ